MTQTNVYDADHLSKISIQAMDYMHKEFGDALEFDGDKQSGEYHVEF